MASSKYEIFSRNAQTISKGLGWIGGIQRTVVASKGGATDGRERGTAQWGDERVFGEINTESRGEVFKSGSVSNFILPSHPPDFWTSTSFVHPGLSQITSTTASNS